MFSAREMSGRRAAFAAELDRAGLAYALVYGANRSGSAVFWLTGWPVTREALLVAGPDPADDVLLVSFFNHVPQARRLSAVRVEPVGQDPAETALGLITARAGRPGRIGVAGPLPFGLYRRLTARTGEVVDLNPACTRLRLVKSPEEVAALRRGAELSDAAIGAIEAALRPGVTDHQVIAAAEHAYVADGGMHHIHYLGVTAMDSPAVAVPEQWPTGRVIRRRDVVTCEISAAAAPEYAGQVLRTFTVGAPPTALYADLHAVAVAAFDAIAGRLRPGAHAGDLAAAAAALIGEAGFTGIDDLVHGFGGGYLPPVVSAAGRDAPAADLTLAAGMTLVVQPNVATRDGRAGVQTGELLLVSEMGTRAAARVPGRPAASWPAGSRLGPSGGRFARVSSFLCREGGGFRGFRKETDMDGVQQGTVTTKVPARLDRLPWSRWHWMIVTGLGTVWILDGLEVTIVGNISGQIGKSGSGIDITQAQVTGLGAAMYVLGACLGALFFGWLTDRFGRKKLFMITLGVYLAATALTALAFAPWWFFLFRFLTGFGIGGEYAAINSAIDELIPSRHRGRVDIIINGTYWAGAAFGALLTVPATSVLPVAVGWRACFALGVVLGLVVLLVRRNVPESPRWLFIHGRGRDAENLVDGIEHRVARETGSHLPEPSRSMTIRQRKTIGFVTIAKTMFTLYPRRTILGFSLFIGQAFLYNAITFGFAQILATFFHVTTNPGYYFAVIAVGNLLGPLLLGPLFDTVGRKPMITATYIGSGVLLLVTAYLFSQHLLTAVTMTACWSVVLFFASAGASSAYLTVSEVFPMETRALAIAFFYAIGTAAGGISGPLLFSSLVSTGKVADTVVAFSIGAGLMILAGITEIFLGVRAERRSLEDIAQPLTAADAAAQPAPRPAG